LLQLLLATAAASKLQTPVAQPAAFFLFTEEKMEDPFLKIRGKVCGEWLVPPPVVAGNLKTFLHKFCSTQFTICWQLALSFRKY